MLYYSPEIITGQKYYGPEVDCWCLGITLFRMTAGFEPFSHAHSKFCCCLNVAHSSPSLLKLFFSFFSCGRIKKRCVQMQFPNAKHTKS